MYNILDLVKSLVKSDKIQIDNYVFKLHYRFTSTILIVFSVLLTSKQHFGDPIKCDVEQRTQVVETYCWIYGTYIVKTTLTDSTLPGLGNDPNFTPPWIKQLNKYSVEDKIIWQKYYQWVCIAFFLQALLFYMPRYLWKTWEGGRLNLLIKDFSGPLIVPEWNSSLRDKSVEYLLSGKYTHNLYAIRYTFCEVLNFLNVIAQIYFMDWFLTGELCFYGLAISSFSQTNLMDQVFPKLTKCKYYKFGPSGSKISLDALCVLPLNVLNEKLFLFLWGWLALLFVLTLFSVVYRFFVILVPKARAYLLMSQGRFIKLKQAKMISSELSYGDFFVLYHIGKNVNPIIYKDIVIGIHEIIINKKSFQKYPENDNQRV